MLCLKADVRCVSIVNAGDSGDVAMLTVFDEVIGPAIERFSPDIILVSAG